MAIVIVEMGGTRSGKVAHELAETIKDIKNEGGTIISVSHAFQPPNADYHFLIIYDDAN